VGKKKMIQALEKSNSALRAENAMLEKRLADILGKKDP
jgi:hypothetical protein